MDAVKFLKESARMCDSQKSCDDCPFLLPDRYCLRDLLDNPSCGRFEEAVNIVEKWSTDHPVKTKLMDFLEKYPEARLQPRSGVPELHPDILGYCGDRKCETCDKRHYTITHCWDSPLEK